MSDLTVSYRRLLNLSNGHISQENQELNQEDVESIQRASSCFQQISCMLCYKDLKSSVSPVSVMNPSLTHLPLSPGNAEWAGARSLQNKWILCQPTLIASDILDNHLLPSKHSSLLTSSYYCKSCYAVWLCKGTLDQAYSLAQAIPHGISASSASKTLTWYDSPSLRGLSPISSMAGVFIITSVISADLR